MIITHFTNHSEKNAFPKAILRLMAKMHRKSTSKIELGFPNKI